MSEPPRSEVLGSLPHTRPHRRSDKRPPPQRQPAATPDQPASPKRPRATAARQGSATKGGNAKPRRPPRSATGAAPARPATSPSSGRQTPARSTRGRGAPAEGPVLLGTAVQAAAELAEIGLTVSARAVRQMISRLPRP